MSAPAKTANGGATRGEPLALARATRWFRERIQAAQDARALPALKRPRTRRLVAPRRGWLAGWWSARLAAGSGIALDEFLRHRLSRYASALPVPPDRLPIAIGVDEAGAVTAVPRAEAERAAPPWLAGYLRSYGAPAVQTDIHVAQGDVARLAAAIAEQQPRIHVAQAALDDASRDPSVAEIDGGSAEGLGRPPVPTPWAAGLYALALAFLLAEAWQLAMPVLEAAGVRTAALPEELLKNPAGVVLGFAFAVGAAVSLFCFVDLALRRARALFEALPAPRRARWTALAAAAALGFAAAVSWSIAGLRPGATAVDVQYARFTMFLLALALPFTASILVQLARRLRARRDEALAAATAWDQAHYRALAEWGRRAAALAAEQRELLRLEVEHGAALRRLRALRQRAQLAERYASEAADAEAADLERLCHAISSSLELDRYEFLRHAGPRSATAERGQPARPAGERRRDGERSFGLAS